MIWYQILGKIFFFGVAIGILLASLKSDNCHYFSYGSKNFRLIKTELTAGKETDLIFIVS